MNKLRRPTVNDIPQTSFAAEILFMVLVITLTPWVAIVVTEIL